MLGQSGMLARGKGCGERNDERVNGRVDDSLQAQIHCIYGIMSQAPSELDVVLKYSRPRRGNPSCQSDSGTDVTAYVHMGTASSDRVKHLMSKLRSAWIAYNITNC